MSSVKSSFIEDVKSFASNNKVLCVATCGIAIAVYAVGNLAGRTVSWISKCFGTTDKTDSVGRKSISNPANLPELSKNLSTKSISEQLPTESSSKIEEFIESLKNENGVKIRGSEADTWHEIVFDDHPYDKSKVKCPWKLHISPGPDTIAVLDVVKPVLLKNKPYCKIVQNQEKLASLENSRDVNDKYVYKGKCLTIYPKSEEEALTLAIELNKALIASNLTNSNKKQQPCTDRPLGVSGYLWSRNDLAGGPIDELSMKDSDHAHAMPGNYDRTVILPMKAYDFKTDESGRKDYTKWYDREFPNFQRIVHKDIFQNTFGSVHWVGDPQSDQGRFETT